MKSLISPSSGDWILFCKKNENMRFFRTKSITQTRKNAEHFSNLWLSNNNAATLCGKQIYFDCSNNSCFSPLVSCATVDTTRKPPWSSPHQFCTIFNAPKIVDALFCFSNYYLLVILAQLLLRGNTLEIHREGWKW
jgi:hypothetical protein